MVDERALSALRRLLELHIAGPMRRESELCLYALLTSGIVLHFYHFVSSSILAREPGTVLQSVTVDTLVHNVFDAPQKAALLAVLLLLSRSRDLLSCEKVPGNAVKAVRALCEPENDLYGVCVLSNVAARVSFGLPHALECLVFLEECKELFEDDDTGDGAIVNESAEHDYPAHHNDPFANAQLALHKDHSPLSPSRAHLWRLVANVSAIGTLLCPHILLC